jgi:ribosomal protein S18 acetylase RimI-like enzyme
MPRPPTFIVRHATCADLGALLALEETTFESDRISRAQWRRHIDSATATVLVGESTTGSIDAAALLFYRRGSRHARLYSLAVGAHARGSGRGVALLTAAESEARARGCLSMRLEVRIDNPLAIAFYERHGYVRLARLPRFYQDGMDGWRYVKSLTTVMP